MKNNVGALLLALSTVGLYEPAWATSDGPDFFAVRDVASNDVLYVREKPSAGSAKVGQIPYNARGIRNMGCHAFLKGQEVINSDIPLPGTTLWCKVRHERTDGWVNARFLKEDAEAQTEEQDSAASADQIPAQVQGTWSTRCTDASAPRVSIGSRAITIFSNGQRHVYSGVEVSHTWYGGAKASGDRVWLPTSKTPDGPYDFIAAPPPYGKKGFLILEEGNPDAGQEIKNLFGPKFSRCP